MTDKDPRIAAARSAVMDGYHAPNTEAAGATARAVVAALGALPVGTITAAQAAAYDTAARLCHQRAEFIRDNAPKGKDGLMTAHAGAAMGAWFDAGWMIFALKNKP